MSSPLMTPKGWRFWSLSRNDDYGRNKRLLVRRDGGDATTVRVWSAMAPKRDLICLLALSLLKEEEGNL